MKSLILILSILCHLSAWAFNIEPTPKIIAIEEDTTWLEVAKKYNDLYIAKYKPASDYAEDLKRWNKHIKTQGPKTGDRIYVEAPSSPFISWNYSQPLEPTDFFSRKFNLLAFYTVSKGAFQEKLSNGATIDFEQNSPGTLGLMVRYQLANKDSLSASIYGSKLTTSTVTGVSSENIDVPLEIGATLYHEIGIGRTRTFNYYYGLDYEKFSSSDPEKVDVGEFGFVSNTMTFVTGGLSLYKNFGKHNIIGKISGSYGVLSSSSDGRDGYKGYKTIGTITYISSSRLSYNIFVKNHSLTRETDELSSTRIGLGVGLRFY